MPQILVHPKDAHYQTLKRAKKVWIWDHQYNQKYNSTQHPQQRGKFEFEIANRIKSKTVHNTPSKEDFY